jgi:hypothetical protein
MKWLNGNRIRLILAGFIATIILGCLELANGATITVGPGADCDFDTIQEGIDATSDGDMLLVAPGEYVITEPITFRGKAITVLSETGQYETIIRMGTPADTNHGSVVVFENNETTESVLDGFTITGGRGFWFSFANAFGGGGILFNASSGTIKNCAIIQNTATYGGGVICWDNLSAILSNCTIVENSADLVNGSGGGVFCGQNSSAILTNCTIVDNSAGMGGGGVNCSYNSSMTMTGCTILENSTARHGAGGVFCEGNSSQSITNCIITKNSGRTECGGILCWENSLATITNSIVWGNTASEGNEVRVRDGGTISISYSDVAGGQTAAVIDNISTINWGEGNIDAEPFFADPDKNDYHLKSQAGRWDPNTQTWVQDYITSPCIDAGDPMSPIGWELFPNGGFVNMGPYGGTPKASKTYFGEPICETIVAGDINGDGQVNRADLEIMALHWTDEEPLLLP